MAFTDDEEAVLRSFVGDTADLGDMEEAYDRLGNFDEVVLETLRHQLSVMVSDETSLFVIDGMTLNKTENIRALERKIKDFKNQGGTGLEEEQTMGTQVVPMTRPQYR